MNQLDIYDYKTVRYYDELSPEELREHPIRNRMFLRRIEEEVNKNACKKLETMILYGTDTMVAMEHPHALIDGIKRVIVSPPCTIILWVDGTKTIVRCGPNDEFDPEKGIAMCILKKMFGSSHQMSKWMKEQIEYEAD